VAAVADEADVGRAGWLWLVRPDGWREELDGLVATAAARKDEARDAREERSARKRLAAAEAASARAEAVLAVRSAELDELRPALAEERGERARAEARVAELEQAVEELTVARSEAVRQLKRVEARLVERSTEANALRSRLREVDPGVREAARAGPTGALEPSAGSSPAGVGVEPTPSAGAASGAASTTSPTRTEPPLAAADAAVTDVPAGDTSASNGDGAGTDPLAGRPAPGTASDPTPASTPDLPPASPGSSLPPDLPPAGPGSSLPPDLPPAGPGSSLPPDLTRDMAAELARTAEGAAVLAEGLARLARLARQLGGATGPTDPTAGAGTDAPLAPTAGEAPGGAAEPVPRRPGGTAPGRRVPLALPGGVFDDSPEAAAHLLRVPGIVLVVDGYNVSMTAWPELGAGDQRRRLVAALEDLAARSATPTEVVFDGAEVDAVWAASTGRRLVRVRFSSPDIEADDVVIDIVGRLPVATPVVVASSDKRVRTDARRAGANLLHAHQLVSLLRR
jgi:predicted RNA-binding protein with PIN domain